ncbi:MAG: hypothetical protein WBA46_05005, partial [Thermomicrobiales bacterium]
SRRAIPGSGGISWADLRKRFSNTPYGWPQDAIDGSIAVMVGAGMVNALRSNTPLQARDLSKQQASTTMLIGEEEVVSRGEYLKARGPFQVLYGTLPNEEEVRNGARGLVADLMALSRKAGGEPPAPIAVPPAYLTEMEFQTGNALVKALVQHKDAIEADVATWREREQRIADRMPGWRAALSLASHASALPESADLRAQLDAIRDQRLLLNTPDPVVPIARDLGNLLRQALSSRMERYRQVLDDGIVALKGSDEWVRLSPTQQEGVLRGNKLVPSPPSAIGSEQDLLAALAKETPAQWDDKINALPTHFDRADAEIVRLLEPEVQEVSLEKPIFRKPIDVETWLLKTREALLSHVNDGHPVRIR